MSSHRLNLVSQVFHFDGGWAVTFVRVMGKGYSVTVNKDGESLADFPASTTNYPVTKRKAESFIWKALRNVRKADD